MKPLVSNGERFFSILIRAIHFSFYKIMNKVVFLSKINDQS
ncbi:hypothetical protein NBRC111894_4035 [Sporolactobacillus inulinus]|uniref:Uncharacterized protein n=1 Tax=Sporolactobacillus inulinus TaxID=2078 RepID=A0A4Y1ZHN8_9BACL|nr:hypothetical protein NBRC111894_4035 [Sporolactobacillus inulinus]